VTSSLGVTYAVEYFNHDQPEVRPPEGLMMMMMMMMVVVVMVMSFSFQHFLFSTILFLTLWIYAVECKKCFH